MRVRAILMAVFGLLVLPALVAGCSGGSAADSEDVRSKSGSAKSKAANTTWPAQRPRKGEPVLRAVVSDAKTSDVRVVDVITGKTLKRFELEGPARLIPVGDGTRVLAPQLSAGRLHVVDAGVRVSRGYGDRLDEGYLPPYLTPGKLKVPKPIHVVPYGNHVTVFADGDGTAHIMHPDDMGVAAERVVRTGRAHHGVAVELHGGDVLASLPAKDKKEVLPYGVQVFDLSGKKRQEFRDCPKLHGEYAAADTVALFGCADGVLVLEKKDDRWSARKLPNPAGTRAGERAGAFVGGGFAPILGTFSGKAMLAVDLEKSRTKRIALPSDLAAYAWDDEWNHAVILTADGDLHIIDPAKGRLLYTTKVTEPFKVARDHESPKPMIAPGRDAVYVSDPHTRRLIEVGVSKKGFEVSRTLKLDFTPASLAITGLPVDQVQHNDGHGREEDHDHGHEHGPDHE